MRTAALAALFRMRTWTLERPALASALFARGLAYEPLGAKPTYLYSLFKTADGQMRAYVRPGGPAYVGRTAHERYRRESRRPLLVGVRHLPNAGARVRRPAARLRHHPRRAESERGARAGARRRHRRIAAVVSQAAPLRVGIDVGGTFTDVVVVDAATRAIVARMKVPTTHDAPEGVAAGIVAGLARALAAPGVDARRIAFIAHSTTQATNASARRRRRARRHRRLARTLRVPRAPAVARSTDTSGRTRGARARHRVRARGRSPPRSSEPSRRSWRAAPRRSSRARPSASTAPRQSGAPWRPRARAARRLRPVTKSRRRTGCARARAPPRSTPRSCRAWCARRA